MHQNKGIPMDSRITVGNGSLQDALQPYLGVFATDADKVAAVRSALEGPQGRYWREELGKWTVREVPVEMLVPEALRDWRPLVRESVLFVVSKLSASRLAPKVIEQMGLGNESPEVRLLRFIARVPGLQKIGQVLARNRTLHPRLRRALTKLENGISDVSIEDIREIIEKQLQEQMQTYAIKLESSILSEASVSAVVGFTWKNPASGRRERGVFKVLKPYIPNCYAEDMKILGQLAQHLTRKHHAPGINLHRVAETITDIRQLLQHEVDFEREQATLASCLEEYRSLRGVRVPQLIPALSTASITALSFERGKKVTAVQALPVELRVRIAETVAKSLLAVPMFSREEDSIFHADPHAGNLLYDRKHNDLVILDWALTERLTSEQRRNVLLLMLMTGLRDADRMAAAIEELCHLNATKHREEVRVIRRQIEDMLDELPLTQLPGPAHAMRLLEQIALEGIRLPAALLMFRKAFFTLEGVVDDVAGSRVSLNSLVTEYSIVHWKDTAACLIALLSMRDWATVEWSALTFTYRMWTRMFLRPWKWLPELFSNAGTDLA
jgi:predicted unusual protein kinase regulating ubiquinone biosynthesis (AarF/ABC1/UbiB family)